MLEIKADSPDVVGLSGRFDGVGAASFDQWMRQEASRRTPLVLDFGGVTYLSSAGIRSLVLLEKKLRANHAHVILAALPPVVAQSLEMTGLLGQFAVAPTLAQARERLGAPAAGAASELTLSWGGRGGTARRLPEPQSQLVVWDAPPGASRAWRCATLDELPLAIGRGGFGNSREQAEESFGAFLTAGTTAILSPDAAPCPPDDLQSDKPEAVSFYVAEAAAIRGRPAILLRLDGAGATLGELATALPEWVGKLTGASPSTLAFLLHASPPSPGGDDWLALGLWRTSAQAWPPASRGFRPSDWTTVSPSAQFLGGGIRLTGGDPLPDVPDPEALLARALDPGRFQGVAPLPPDLQIGRCQAWVYLPDSILSASDTRLRIEINGDMHFPDEWDLIARRIYTDARRVVLTRMSGGYSATTMRADSYDADGRQMIPTVLKISSLAMTRAEVRAYHEYVKKFILNNSTVIMGHATQGNWSGLRYNFVGVNGPDSTLSWLADHYVRRPVETLKPLVDAVFGQVLWAWYGQPKREILRPFEQHDPARLFPGIPEQAERIMGISADTPTIPCEELGRDLPNPYHFLRHEFPRLRSWTAPWLSTITHGDLNLNNILLDEKENIYIIDFSETGPRNAVSDFARIEPVITLQMTRLEAPSDMKDLLVFLEGLVSVSPLKGDPPLRYSGSDPMVAKAWHVLCQLRGYARKTVGGDDQPLFYWLPLLEWTIPSVYFVQLSPERKRLWMFAAALLCEQIRNGLPR